ncbi:MAG: polyprenyl diphosphate synthase [Dehalococcoidia bacterium]|nr:polyprenyl diphosphate synthase [Dehalococcoidia bacterium]
MSGEVPGHVAIIMDGNGRWAKERGWGRSEGHRLGTENVRRVVRALAKRGVSYVTIYAFSTENWDRPAHEVHSLMELLGRTIESETSVLHAEGVRIRHLGRLDRLPESLQAAVERSVELTRRNNTITLSVAFDYGGREEIVGAARRLIESGIDARDLTEQMLAAELYTAGMPDPDLIIRTAGEMRLSNFLLWQSAYAEYYSTSTLWPDFDEADLELALEEYERRQRRFGRIEAAAP